MRLSGPRHSISQHPSSERVQMKNMSPSVNVIITYHNEGNQLLHRAIESIEQQRYEGPLEIVVVDDASDIAPSLPKNHKYPISIVRSDANVYAAAARNLGALACHGEYISFLDADDIYINDKINSQASFLESHPEVSFVGSGGVIRQFDKVWSYDPELVLAASGKEMMQSSHVLPKHASQVIGIEYCYHTSGFMTRRNAFLQVGCFDSSYRWGEEWDLQIKLAQVGRVGYIPGEVYEYIYRHGSITRTDNPRKFVSQADINRYIYKNIDMLTYMQRILVRKRECKALLLAAQLYFENEFNPSTALRCSARSIMAFPSIWGFRSLIRYSLHVIAGLV